MQASFDNTVQILVKAFLEGTLRKGSCAACAVGNICAAALGVGVDMPDLPLTRHGWLDSEDGPMWHHLFMSTSPTFQTRSFEQDDFDTDEVAVRMGIEQIGETGYTIAQLADVERAFESAHIKYNEEAEFAGLMAVVDVLADIHGIDLATAEVAKGLFVRA